MPRCAAAFSLAGLLLHALPAGAQPKVCVEQHASAKAQRKQGALLDAKRTFLQCATDSCPEVIREECQSLVTKLAKETPSVVIGVQDQDGRDVVNGRAFIDGAEVKDWLAGRGHELDPGPHRLRFEATDGRKGTLAFAARSGEKNRRLLMKLRGPVPTSQPAHEGSGTRQDSSGAPVGAYIFSGVAAAAFGTFAYFALDGNSKKRDLDHCKPDCAQRDVDTLRRSYLIGDVSLAVGVVALGGATYFFLSHDPTPQPEDGPRANWLIHASGQF
ncbi:MAG: hypothetical protein KDB14_33555 [Planctomycetales bacterium]|nr:hypothetical protein [Planctomycetales bacterium]